MLFGNRPLKTQNAKFNPYFLNNTFYTTMRYATPSALTKLKGIFPNLVQSTTANQPSVSGGVVTFDGVDDFYTNDTSNIATYVKQTQMPDASGSDTGKGFTCTGLSRDSEGNWWFANFGLNKNGNSGQQPSIVKTDSNMNLLKEILLKPIDNTITGVQGLQIEKATNYAWVAVSDLGKIYIIDTNNSSLVKTFTVDAAPNGIALDEVNQRFFILYVNGNSTPIVKSYSMSNGAFIEEFTGFAGLTFGDHLFYDAETQILWVITGSNAYNAGRLYAYSTNRKVVSGSVGLMEGDAVEGIYLDFSANKLYVANDAYFHELDINAGGDATLKNSLLEYDFDASFLRAQYYKAYTELEVDIVIKVNNLPSWTSRIYGIGDPLSGQGVAAYIVGTGTDPNGKTLRVILHNGSSQEAVDFTLDTAVTVKQIVNIVIDFTNKAITIKQNGIYQDIPRKPYSLAMTSLVYSQAALGAQADGSRALSMELYDFAVTDTIRSNNDIDRLGKYWSGKNNIQWSNTLKPEDVSDLILYLDASDDYTITQVGGSVSQWSDKSGNNNNATQVINGKQPTTGNTIQNGLNVLDFDGGDHLILPSGVYSVPNGNSTLFVVSKQTSNVLDYIISMTELEASRYCLRYNSGQTDIGFRSRPAADNTVTVTGGDSTKFQALMGYRNGTTQAASINGGAESSNTLAADENGIDGAFIGQLSDSGGFVLTGSIAEIILYNVNITTVEKRQIIGYLKTKWKIQ